MYFTIYKLKSLSGFMLNFVLNHVGVSPFCLLFTCFLNHRRGGMGGGGKEFEFIN